MSTNNYTIVFDDRNDESKQELAKVFIKPELIDDDLYAQIRAYSKKKCINKPVRIMPDAHAGEGCCVGMSFPLGDSIIPSLIGGDIGCGIITYKIPISTNDKSLTDKLKKEKFLEKLDLQIRNLIPMGVSYHSSQIITKEHLTKLYERANLEADLFSKSYLTKFNVDISTFKPNYNEEWFKSLSKKIGANRDMVMRGLGTLGGGNHFIELNRSEIGYYITIHCGSRKFGQLVCKYHQDKITKVKNIDLNIKKDNEIKRIKKLYKKNKATLEEKMKELEEKYKVEVIPDVLKGDDAYEYYFDMIFAQKYAELNREIILENILSLFGISVASNLLLEENLIQSVHNYIDFNDFFVRKGAIAARNNQSCIIALNMAEGILICKGKGNEDWNNSCAHGAGRIVSRTESKQLATLEEFKKIMLEANVVTSSIVESCLDESPFAYKDSKLIKESIQESVEIISQLKPILNLKAT